MRVESKNFTLVGDAGDKDIRRVAIKLEQYRETLKLLFPKSNMERQVPTLVFVFSSHDAFRQFKPRVNGKIAENIAGYIMERPEAMYVAVTEETRGGLTPYEAIFHEYYHYILDNNFDNPPPWLNEGLAEFYSTFEMEKDGKSFRLGSPIARHFYSFREREILPLEKLFNTRYGSKEFNERNKDNIFYAESWAFVHFLMLGEQGKRQEQFIKFISQLNSGLPLAENFNQSFQTDFKKMENEFRQYIRRNTLPVNDYTMKNEVEFESSLQSRPLDEAEVELELGKLLWNLREREMAEKRLQKAFILAPDSAPANAWLGYLRMWQEKYDEAGKLLSRSIEIDSKDYLAHTFNAYLLSAQKKQSEAIKEFERSIELQPKRARLYANLAAYQSSIGSDTQAFVAYSNALRLDPREPSYFYSSSIVALRMHRGLPASLQAQTWLRIRGWDKDSSPYAALIAYFGYRQVQQNQNAEKVLQIAGERLSRDVWGYSIVLYLQRQISAEELLRLAATDKDKLTEAHGYIGLDLTLSNQASAAMSHFEWVKDNGNQNFIEYSFALAELKRAAAEKNPQTK